MKPGALWGEGKLAARTLGARGRGHGEPCSRRRDCRARPSRTRPARSSLELSAPQFLFTRVCGSLRASSPAKASLCMERDPRVLGSTSQTRIPPGRAARAIARSCALARLGIIASTDGLFSVLASLGEQNPRWCSFVRIPLRGIGHGNSPRAHSLRARDPTLGSHDPPRGA